MHEPKASALCTRERYASSELKHVKPATWAMSDLLLVT